MRCGSEPMGKKERTSDFSRFDVFEIAKKFPDTADTMLLDTYLTNEEAASSRVIRVYKPFPPHYHPTCDEYLYVLRGKGIFWMGSPEQAREFEPGHLLFFRKGVVHAIPEMTELPVVFLSVDTPRRDPKAIIFVNPKEATPESFISAIPNR
jgi:mannose-6-phosphate isomerase-like protein (cupin superfamily)